MGDIEIADSARKRCNDDEIMHAVRNCIRWVQPLEEAEDDPALEGVTLIIGPTRSGKLLEILALDGESDWEPPCIFHAMDLRAKFSHYLGG